MSSQAPDTSEIGAAEGLASVAAGITTASGESNEETQPRVRRAVSLDATADDLAGRVEGAEGSDNESEEEEEEASRMEVIGRNDSEHDDDDGGDDDDDDDEGIDDSEEEEDDDSEANMTVEEKLEASKAREEECREMIGSLIDQITVYRRIVGEEKERDKQRLAALSEQLDAQKKLVAELEERLECSGGDEAVQSKLQAMSDELQAERERNAQLRVQTLANLKALQQDLVSIEEANKTLNTQLAEERAMHKQTLQQLWALQKQVNRPAPQVRAQEVRLRLTFDGDEVNAVAMIPENDQERAKLKEESDFYQSKCHALNQKHTVLVTELEEARSSLARTTEQAQRLGDELSALKKSHSTVLDELSRVQAERDTLKAAPATTTPVVAPSAVQGKQGAAAASALQKRALDIFTRHCVVAAGNSARVPLSDGTRAGLLQDIIAATEEAVAEKVFAEADKELRAAVASDPLFGRWAESSSLEPTTTLLEQEKQRDAFRVYLEALADENKNKKKSGPLLAALAWLAETEAFAKHQQQQHAVPVSKQISVSDGVVPQTSSSTPGSPPLMRPAAVMPTLSAAAADDLAQRARRRGTRASSTVTPPAPPMTLVAEHERQRKKSGHRHHKVPRLQAVHAASGGGSTGTSTSASSDADDTGSAGPRRRTKHHAHHSSSPGMGKHVDTPPLPPGLTATGTGGLTATKADTTGRRAAVAAAVAAASSALAAERAPSPVTVTAGGGAAWSALATSSSSPGGLNSSGGDNSTGRRTLRKTTRFVVTEVDEPSEPVPIGVANGIAPTQSLKKLVAHQPRRSLIADMPLAVRTPAAPTTPQQPRDQYVRNLQALVGDGADGQTPRKAHGPQLTVSGAVTCMLPVWKTVWVACGSPSTLHVLDRESLKPVVQDIRQDVDVCQMGLFCETVWIASSDKDLRLLNPRDPQFVRLLPGHERGPVYALAGEGKRVWSVGADRLICVWDAESAKLRKKIRTQAFMTCLLAAQRTVWVGTSLGIAFYDADTLKPIKAAAPRTEADEAKCERLARVRSNVTKLLRVEGRVWAVHHESELVSVWDVASRALLSVVEAKRVRDLLYVGGLVWSCSWDNVLRCWDPKTLLVVRELVGAHDDTVAALAAAKGPAGWRVWSGAADHTVCVWETGARPHDLEHCGSKPGTCHVCGRSLKSITGKAKNAQCKRCRDFVVHSACVELIPQGCSCSAPTDTATLVASSPASASQTTPYPTSPATQSPAPVAPGRD